ncbi:zinc-binding dehydrogenase [uncultured Agrobacterium sp.]|uniref:MDR/zinc-dependent alcohol dehydrogenase-like family protein n=1 Tax=uncultured Agrobacterium sp. TaxID=157277 RepID=UPI00258FCF6A|nr:zinc-binding dehydrogenase [uncultured Agrobacterium sp.]
MNVMTNIENATMKAAVVTGPGMVEVQELALPVPGTHQVRIKLEGCGVCASNLGPWAGPDWMQFPTEAGGLGHEGWGVIDAVGEGVKDFTVGNRVAALSYHAYASHDIADENMLVHLPAELEGLPFPGEPLGCAMNIFTRADIREGQTVAIIGVGFLGSLLIQLAARKGARVIAISRRPYALEAATEAGAAVTITMDDHWKIIDEVKSLTNGALCERVIEAVGKQWPLDLAADLTGERGRLIVAGYHQDGARQVNMQAWNWKGIDVINAHERDPAIYIEGIRQAVSAVQAGNMNPFPLLTHSYPLSELATALNETRDRPNGFMKALIRF